jgi:hexulose-6-phosphate isomerase (EC 5.-.-.-)
MQPEVGAYVIAITTYPESPLGQLADLVVMVPGSPSQQDGRLLCQQILGLHELLALWNAV